MNVEIVFLRSLDSRQISIEEPPTITYENVNLLKKIRSRSCVNLNGASEMGSKISPPFFAELAGSDPSKLNPGGIYELPAETRQKETDYTMPSSIPFNISSSRSLEPPRPFLSTRASQSSMRSNASEGLQLDERNLQTSKSTVQIEDEDPEVAYFKYLRKREEERKRRHARSVSSS
ncbi:hypothetical protein G7Y89_g12651 [Cudoniella acicularis]|uniref:Uncharacterized protein n=1 Tax=Cudoniella acicularis TaxID=354080 RepID=A0A8H4RA09_9HELO|nr:hypothetical protein G7Y89_g12651 [Cudoniella acicularis]